MGELKQKVSRGMAWALMEKACSIAVSFGVTLVLARLLTPEDYGTIALLAIFIAVARTIADCGFGQALVQKKDATEEDFNSVFYVSILLSGVAYFILFALAPAISRFYGIPGLSPIFRVLSVTLVFNAINSVQNAELSRKLLFDLSFRITFLQSVVSAATGVSMALLGYGPWALVWSQVAGGAAGTVARWFVIAWRPKPMFSASALAGLFSFGWKMTLSSLINSVFTNLSGMLIGKIYTKADLAYCERGQSLPFTAMSAINGAVERVSFPALARLQDERARVRDGMRTMMKCVTFLVFPAMAGCAVCAPSLVPLLYGEQWIRAVPYMQIACLTAALWPFHTLNLQAISALGRSDMFLRLEIIKKIVAIGVILVFVRRGVFTFVLASALVASPLSVLINSFPNRKLLSYSIGRQILDVMPNLGATLFMAMCSASAGCLFCKTAGGWVGEAKTLGALCVVLVQVCAGVASYAAIAVLARMESLSLCLELVPARLKSRLGFLPVFFRQPGDGSRVSAR